MPRQNRVTPIGEIVAHPARGTLMGNRGVLHDPEGRIVRRWTTRAWIACVLEFKGRRRAIMAPNRYTELFFLDEATALAAGHRPCAECRRADFLRFRAAWLAGNPEHRLGPRPRVAELDRVLHAERIGPRGKPIWAAPVAALPDGVMVLDPGAPIAGDAAPIGASRAGQPAGHDAFLLLGGRLLPWTPRGYGPPRDVPGDAAVPVLTPATIAAAIRAGYIPALHPSATTAGAAHPGAPRGAAAARRAPGAGPAY
jgi:hypothetical protein